MAAPLTLEQWIAERSYRFRRMETLGETLSAIAIRRTGRVPWGIVTGLAIELAAMPIPEIIDCVLSDALDDQASTEMPIAEIFQAIRARCRMLRLELPAIPDVCISETELQHWPAASVWRN